MNGLEAVATRGRRRIARRILPFLFVLYVLNYVIGYLTDRTGSYVAGTYYLVAAGLVGGGTVLSLRSSSSRQAGRMASPARI